jgi:microcystin degradation protein MlrC
LLGFPYADVHEMGAATIAVADNDELAAASAANQLANALIKRRESYRSELVDVEAALDQCERLPTPICLLDMGDNVGGGSAADGTSLLAGLLRRSMTSFVCLCDPDSVLRAERAGVGCSVAMQLGGKTDTLHGEPVAVQCTVASLHDGKFSESQPRHGGMTHFDQGPTAIVRTANVAIMLTSKRMVPFSLQQLYACDLDPTQFQVLAAKGVHAPLAAYREACRSILRVNTPGSTSADMHSLKYEHRRRPLFPFESPF